MSPPGDPWIIGVISTNPHAGRESSEEHVLRKHNVTMDEVEQVCRYGAPDYAKWVSDPVRGDRLRLEGHTEGGRYLRCYLRPIGGSDDGVYMLITAMEVKKP